MKYLQDVALESVFELDEVGQQHRQQLIERKKGEGAERRGQGQRQGQEQKTQS